MASRLARNAARLLIAMLTAGLLAAGGCAPLTLHQRLQACEIQFADSPPMLDSCQGAVYKEFRK